MANPLGTFDPTAVPDGWFDETLQPIGWYDRDLLDVAAAGGAYTLTCDAGAYTIAGQDATLRKSKLLAADAGAYAIAGQDAALKVGRRLTADAGAYVIAGQDAAFVYVAPGAYTLTCDAGEYVISGQDAAFVVGLPRQTGGGWAEWAKAEKRRREAKKQPEEVMEVALEPVVSAPRKTITMASLIGKQAAAEFVQFDSSAAVAISRRRKRQREDELLLLM